jgi:hypothetical protein
MVRRQGDRRTKPLEFNMNYNSLMALIRSAAENVKKIAPDHNPWAGHLLRDPKGKSRFSFENAGLGTIADLLGRASIVSVKFQRNALIVTADCNWETGCAGWSVTNEPIPENKYVMTMVHGMLQAKGSGRFVERADNYFTVVMTEEAMPDGTTDLALASIYPGQPDPEYSLEGLHENDVLTGAELIERGITRVC